jgi:hypothetical protein
MLRYRCTVGLRRREHRSVAAPLRPELSEAFVETSGRLETLSRVLRTTKQFADANSKACL